MSKEKRWIKIPGAGEFRGTGLWRDYDVMSYEWGKSKAETETQWQALQVSKYLPTQISMEKPVDAFSYGSSFISHRYDPIPRMVIYDECHYIRPEEYWIGNPTPKEKDWDRKSFKSGGSTAPTDEVRAKLRAKRKAKKK